MPYRKPRRLYAIIAGSATLAIMLSFLLAAVKSRESKQESARFKHVQLAADHRACVRINRVYLTIQQQLGQSLKTYPQIAYYKSHPRELRRVVRNTIKEIQAFAPEKC